MKKIIITLLLTSSVLFAKDFMISSLPSSGSTWFLKVIQDSVPFPEQCFNEFFQNLGRSGPGVTPEVASKIFTPIDQEKFNSLLQSWKNKKGYFTKEIHGYSRLGTYKDHFDIACLYRHRKFTLPYIWLNTIYDGFVLNHYDNQIWESIKNYCLKHVKTDIEKQAAMHIITWYIALKSAQEYHFPIIEYEEIMRLPEKELSEYLQKRLPEKLFSKKLVKNIINTRRTGERYFWYYGRWQGIKYLYNYYIKGQHWIDMRAENYNALGVEPFCQKLIAYMKTLDKDFKYWNLLE